MVNITKEQKGNVLVVRFFGTVLEDVNLEQLIGPAPKEMHVYCKGISGMNSLGVKSWIRFFQNLKKLQTKLTFFECSVTIVSQMNLISNFLAGGDVDSIYVPFCCSKCRYELVGLFKTENIVKLKGNIPNLKCPKCNGDASFDDLPEEYFAFMKSRL